MRALPKLLLVLALAPACTRNVDDRKTYDRCFVDTECDAETTDGCFRLLGETTALGICSVHCADDCQGGSCSNSYLMYDGGSTEPICVQDCSNDDDCPSGGFACRAGSCLPP